MSLLAKLIGDDSGKRARGNRPEQSAAKKLKKWNLAAGILHTVSFVGILILAAWSQAKGDTFQAEITTDFRKYESGGTGPFATATASLGVYPLIWIEVPFSAITAIFHFVLAYHRTTRAKYQLLVSGEERNPWRWIEYSITASLMTWSILQLSGVTNIFMLLLAGVVMNVALQYTGHVMEVVNTPNRRKRRAEKQKWSVDWVPTLVGWLIFSAQWAVIFSYFFTAVQSSTSVPAFVWTVVLGLFFMFASFGFVQMAHFLGVKWFGLDTGYGCERAFIVLSFVSKFSLDWTIVIGIVSNQIG